MSTMLVHLHKMHTVVLDASLVSSHEWNGLERQLWQCMDALRKISNVWMVAKFGERLFEKIIIKTGFESSILDYTKDVIPQSGEGGSPQLRRSSSSFSTCTPATTDPSDSDLSPAMVESMNEALNSMTLNDHGRTTSRKPYNLVFNDTTMVPWPSPQYFQQRANLQPASKDNSDPEHSRLDSASSLSSLGTPESAGYAQIFATIKSHELFGTHLPWN